MKPFLTASEPDASDSRNLRIPYLITPAPFLCLIIPHCLGGMPGHETGQRIHINPDFIGAFPLRFIKNQLHPQMQVVHVNIIGVFLRTVAGAAHIPDYIPGLYNISLFQPFRIGPVLSQMGIIVIPFAVETVDSNPPAAKLIPSKCPDRSALKGDNRRPNLSQYIMSQMGSLITIASRRSKIIIF